MKLSGLLTLFCVLSIGYASAQLSVRDVLPGKVGVTAFKIDQPGKIKISGTGGVYEDDWRTIVYYGWILDSESRKVVWHQIDVMDETHDDLEYGEFDFKDEISLNKGTYELYFTGAHVDRDGFWDGNNIFNIFSSNNNDHFKSDLPNSFFGSRVSFRNSHLDELVISVNGTITRADASELLKAKLSTAVASISKPDRDANIKKGFSLSAPTVLRIYAIGEGRKDEQFDYAWIYNLDKRERVWEMDRFNIDYAGGDDKNSLYDGVVTLPAGNYMLNYVTDDSHHYNDWNAMPPNDPQFTGVTVWTENAKDKSNLVAFKMPEELKPVLEITKVGDNEFISEGLTVKAPMEFRVLCLGEESDDEMVDGGWIINAKTREVVWDMNREFKKKGGGADKNRVVEGTVKLDKGDYIVYYATDGSHSYGDWNSGPPHEQEYWGVTLWASRKEDVSKVARFDPSGYKSANVLAEILHVRDNEYLSESFELSKDTRLRVLSIGEGEDDEMVDYAWIKNTETGKTVWELSYENTEHAGGARKNRLYNDVIILPKGTYKVYYKTDGSHSYRDWNATPPFDQEKYGVSIQVEQ